MCQFTAPPVPFLAGPLQAPGDWLLLAGLLVLIGATVFAYRRSPPRAGQKVGLAVIVCASLAILASMVILELIVFPSSNALTTWAATQRYNLDLHQCPPAAQTAYLATYRHALNGSIATWAKVGYGLLWIGLGAITLWMVVWIAWLSLRPHAPSPR